jgi:two-component system sensor histidine kinase KdpD
VSLQTIADADALRTGLLRSVSHDLRTPLATIGANVSTLLQEDVPWSKDEQRSFLITIDTEVHRLTRLVSNLLDASRLEAGVVHPHVVHVAIDDLVASALATIDTQHRTIDLDIPLDLPLIDTDPDLVERIIANVISNACRFCPSTDAVRISAGVFPTHAEIVVIDKGEGLDISKRASVLKPFERLSDDQTGVGLGLSVANGFATLLGGELRFEDTPGGGLTVSIILPIPETP